MRGHRHRLGSRGFRIGAVFLALVVLLVRIRGRGTSGRAQPGEETARSNADAAAVLENPRRPLPRLSLIIDDFGYIDTSAVRPFLQLDIPFSVAVLPYQPFSRLSAEAAHRAGKEVLLHLPMEGRPGSNPGPDALLGNLKEGELRSRTRKALLDIPYAVGTNNHMGSVLTEDRTKMRWILEEVRAQHLFFVDSRTTKNTVAESLALEMGIPTASRQGFLDDLKGFADIRKEWTRAIRLAERSGSVVVIAHVYPETLEALRVLIPQSRASVRFVLVSTLVR